MLFGIIGFVIILLFVLFRPKRQAPNVGISVIKL